MNRTILLATTAALLLLTGCSSGPSRDQVAERFLIELEGLTGLDPSADQLQQLGTDIADDLAEGYCGKPAYFTGLQETDLQEAVLITCSMYYDDQLTDTQRDQVRAIVLREATEPQ